jgi:hypothetical protein
MQQEYDAYNNAMTTQLLQDHCHPRPKGPCFNCGKVGHFAKDCQSNSSSNINYMDIMDDEMQHVPQPNITPRTNVAHLKAQIDTLLTEDNDALIDMMGSSQDFIPA